jgi:uncharacterized integral membrane protein
LRLTRSSWQHPAQSSENYWKTPRTDTLYSKWGELKLRTQTQYLYTLERNLFLVSNVEQVSLNLVPWRATCRHTLERSLILSMSLVTWRCIYRNKLEINLIIVSNVTQVSHNLVTWTCTCMQTLGRNLMLVSNITHSSS